MKVNDLLLLKEFLDKVQVTNMDASTILTVFDERSKINECAGKYVDMLTKIQTELTNKWESKLKTIGGKQIASLNEKEKIIYNGYISEQEKATAKINEIRNQIVELELGKKIEFKQWMECKINDKPLTGIYNLEQLKIIHDNLSKTDEKDN